MLVSAREMSTQQIQERDELIRAALRPEPLPFSVASEYPIVLARDSAFSYCLVEGNGVVSHANLWPREVIDQSGRVLARVGLIGNVCTDEALRGKGYMRALLRDLEASARDQGLNALILWSELQNFYQNLGYTSWGSEIRYQIGERPITLKSGLTFESVDPAKLSAGDIERLLSLRPQLPQTLKRSADEFRKLLTIPALDLVVGMDQGEIEAFLLTGKGYDMVGVIHEWGGEPHAVVHACDFILKELEFATMLLLCPKPIPAAYEDAFDRRGLLKTSSAMAWGKILEPSELDPDQLFIWGLDSI